MNNMKKKNLQELPIMAGIKLSRCKSIKIGTRVAPFSPDMEVDGLANHH